MRVGEIATCACGKRMYTSRKGAKAAARQLGYQKCSAYRCQMDPDYWHIGHLPEPVIRGRLSRNSIREPIQRERKDQS